MRQDSFFTLSRVGQTAGYALMAVGLFLLFFLGAQAFGRLTDPAQVYGQPRQKPSSTDYVLQSVIPLVDSNYVASAASFGSVVADPSGKNKAAGAPNENANSAKQPQDRESVEQEKANGSSQTAEQKNTGR